MHSERALTCRRELAGMQWGLRRLAPAATASVALVVVLLLACLAAARGRSLASSGSGGSTSGRACGQQRLGAAGGHGKGRGHQRGAGRRRRVAAVAHGCPQRPPTVRLLLMVLLLELRMLLLAWVLLLLLDASSGKLVEVLGRALPVLAPQVLQAGHTTEEAQLLIIDRLLLLLAPPFLCSAAAPWPPVGRRHVFLLLLGLLLLLGCTHIVDYVVWACGQRRRRVPDRFHWLARLLGREGHSVIVQRMDGAVQSGLLSERRPPLCCARTAHNGRAGRDGEAALGC